MPEALCFRRVFSKGFVTLSLETICFAIRFRLNAFEWLQSISYVFHRCLPVRSLGCVLSLPDFVWGVLMGMAIFRYCRVKLRAMECVALRNAEDTWPGLFRCYRLQRLLYRSLGHLILLI